MIKKKKKKKRRPIQTSGLTSLILYTPNCGFIIGTFDIYRAVGVMVSTSNLAPIPAGSRPASVIMDKLFFKILTLRPTVVLGTRCQRFAFPYLLQNSFSFENLSKYTMSSVMG